MFLQVEYVSLTLPYCLPLTPQFPVGFSPYKLKKKKKADRKWGEPQLDRTVDKCKGSSDAQISCSASLVVLEVEEAWIAFFYFSFYLFFK